MKAIMKLCVIAMPLVCGSIYSAENHGVQIPTTQQEHLKKIQEINKKQTEDLYKATVEGYMGAGQQIPSRYLKNLDQETLTLAQQHNQKLSQDLQRK